MINISSEKHYNQRVDSIPAFVEAFLTELKSSEIQLIRFMGWNDPTEPLLKSNLKGNVEYGIFLYLLHHPFKIDGFEVIAAVEIFKGILLLEGKLLPATVITHEQYEQLKTSRRVDSNGTVIATSKYAAFDQHWLIALINLVKTVRNGGLYDSRLPIPAIPYEPIHISSSSDKFIKIGMIGDWGAANKASEDVMHALVNYSKPAGIIHLGDVYYSGTTSVDPKDISYKDLGEEVRNFIDKWPKSFKNKSFTLNSNHEMYSGATGLFNDVLLEKSSPFYGQGQKTIFALAVADWTILGLDSAYNSDPYQLYMYGNLDIAGTFDQIKWIMSLNLDPKKTIVLTHHNGFDAACSGIEQHFYTPFWEQVRYALGGDPYAWYWGHIHNGIVYSNPVKIYPDLQDPVLSKKPVFETTTYCRCLGHGSMPYGKSGSMAIGQNNIAWFSGSESTRAVNEELPNGYVLLNFELDEQGRCKVIDEMFFSTASQDPDYSNRLFQVD